MKLTRRKFSAEFKTKVVLEAFSERLTLTELAQKHKIHPNQITQWKREFPEKASDVFSKGDKAQKDQQDQEQEAEQLYKTIGQLKAEVDFLKKISVVKSLSERRSMVEKEHAELSVLRQCDLLSIHRSGLYYQSKKTSKLHLRANGPRISIPDGSDRSQESLRFELVGVKHHG